MFSASPELQGSCRGRWRSLLTEGTLDGETPFLMPYAPLCRGVLWLAWLILYSVQPYIRHFCIITRDFWNQVLWLCTPQCYYFFFRGRWFAASLSVVHKYCKKSKCNKLFELHCDLSCVQYRWVVFFNCILWLYKNVCNRGNHVKQQLCNFLIQATHGFWSLYCLSLLYSFLSYFFCKLILLYWRQLLRMFYLLYW